MIKSLESADSLREPGPGKVLGNQDMFDQDTGQKSAISGRCLHWISFIFFSSEFYPLSPGLLCNFVRNSPKRGESCPISDHFREQKNAQNPVKSLAVMVSLVPE